MAENCRKHLIEFMYVCVCEIGAGFISMIMYKEIQSKLVPENGSVSKTRILTQTMRDT